MAKNAEVVNIQDERLIANAVSGDMSSFGVIVERYWKMAVALAISKIGDATTAEDVAQESFVKAYSQLNKLRNPKCFAGWLVKIVNQQCVDHIRKNARSGKVISYEANVPEATNCEARFHGNTGLSEEQVHFVRQTIGKLPEKFKEVIVMRFAAGFSAVEIGKQLGKRNGTIRARLHRAYKILKKELAPIFEEVE